MTTVTFFKDNNDLYKGFVCMGHAEYAKHRRLGFGKEPDILCAAVSALVINTINALEELSGEKLEVSSNQETGFIKCDFLEPLSDKSAFLVDFLVYALKNVSAEYGKKYLEIKFE